MPAPRLAGAGAEAGAVGGAVGAAGKRSATSIETWAVSAAKASFCAISSSQTISIRESLKPVAAAAGGLAAGAASAAIGGPRGGLAEPRADSGEVNGTAAIMVLARGSTLLLVAE